MITISLKQNELLEIETDDDEVLELLKQSQVFKQLHPWNNAFQYVPRDEQDPKIDHHFERYSDYVQYIIEKLT